MQLKDHENADSKKVWLTEDEVDDLLTVGVTGTERSSSTEQRIALGLMARCGLRSEETVNVTPADIVQTEAGTFVAVQSGKGDKYRETPIPASLAGEINGYANGSGVDKDAPIVDYQTVTLRKWVARAAETMADETGNERWLHLSAHDLRRTWGTLIAGDVEPGLAMEWGGWDSWQTFRDAYLGHYSIKAQREAREKVDWL